MYIDLIILLILIILVVLFFKRFQFFVFFLAMVETTLRILAFIKNNIGIKDVSNAISKWLPENIFDMIDKYTSSIPLLQTGLKWAFVIIMTIFLGYLIKIFVKKKRI